MWYETGYFRIAPWYCYPTMDIPAKCMGLTNYIGSNGWYRRQMTVMVSQITSQSSVCSTVRSNWQQKNIKGPCCYPFARGIHQWSVDFPHKSTVTQKMFPFDDVIMIFLSFHFHRSVIWSISFYCRPIVSTNKIIVDIISTYVCIRIYEIIIIVISQLQCQQSLEMWEGNVFPKVRCYPCTEQSSYCCLLSVLSTRPICTLFYTRRRDCRH